MRKSMLKCLVALLCAASAVRGGAEVLSSAESGRTVVDMRAGTGVTLPSAGSEALRYSNLWSGDASATVAIVQDGTTLIEGLSGEGAYEWRAPSDGTYTLTYTTYTNGVRGEVETATFIVPVAETVKFAKTAVSVRESAKYAELTVNRTAKTGRVRVRYATEDGTADNDARAGEDYVETSGVLEWADGDRKAKKIRVPLIPDLVAAYDGVPSKAFTVRLSALSVDDLYDFEHLPTFVAGDVCTVTVKETSKKGVTPESVYAKQQPKKATVKQDEDVPLSSGTFYGVIEECGDRLTNGLPNLAAVTFTASTAEPPALSAKVAVAGKTYSFSAKGWDETSDWGDGYLTRTLVNVQKSGKVAYTNELKVVVRDGATADEGAWLVGEHDVEMALLKMDIPDVKGKGMQKDIRYVGSMCRQNDKIQAYLNAVTNFAGYYTVSLTPDGSIGSGYLTLTVDSKGGVKVAGMLADGATKPVTSPKACAIVADESSVNGLAMLVPIHFAKGTVCFGGWLRLRVVNDATNPDKFGRRVVVDSYEPLVWYDDSATGCVALYGDDECIFLTPCGGLYDKVINLQRHYIDHSLSVETVDIASFPTYELPAGYDYVADVSPDGFALALENDKVVYDKRKVVKTDRLTDFGLSVNPCNVSVKLTRATGLVTGGFSLWSEDLESGKQKEITGFKTYGVLLLARDSEAPIDERVIAPGFATKKVKKTYYDDNGRKKTETRPFTAPFNVVVGW